MKHGPGTTVLDIGSGFLEGANNVISVKSLWSKVVPRKPKPSVPLTTMTPTEEEQGAAAAVTEEGKPR